MAVFRSCLLALSLVVIVLTQPNTLSGCWVIPLAAPELYIRGRIVPDRQLSLLGFWWTSLSALAVLWTGGGHSPMLPATAVGVFFAGLGGGFFASLEASGLCSALLLGVWLVGHGQLHESTHDYLGMSAQWVLLSVGFGSAGSWIGRHNTSTEFGSAQRYAEARALIEQLRSVTTKLPGSLDVATTCEVLLESCLDACHATVGAVLLHVGDAYLVPITMRGVTRVPWRHPSVGPGPMQIAWETGQPVIDTRPADVSAGNPGRRAGSTLFVVPVLSPDGVLALVALQVPNAAQFTEEAMKAVRATVEEYAIRLETATLFEQVRSAVTVEERSRLAHDMHDGVAQDVAYIGFELDLLHTKAARVDDALADSITQLRSRTTRIIQDIRASITDLRSSRSVERGLGSALSSCVRNAGAAGPLAVHLTLDESSFRLPAGAEIELFRVAHDFTKQACEGGSARNLWVTLVVEPPTAFLRLQHDGDFHPRDLGQRHSAQRLAMVGGRLLVAERAPSGLLVEASIGEDFS
ncbi:MAG: histidine kinase [Actinomycetota bacterium]